MLMISRMHLYHEVSAEFVRTVNHLADLQIQVDHLAVQLVELIALSADQGWYVDQVSIQPSMDAADIHTARELADKCLLHDLRYWWGS